MSAGSSKTLGLSLALACVVAAIVALRGNKVATWTMRMEEESSRLVVLTWRDFAAEPLVAEWLAELGVANDSEEEVLPYVPRRVVVEMAAANRIGGPDLGASGAGGYVAANLVNVPPSGSNYSSSLLVILNYGTGELHRVYPTFATTPSIHFCGLKLIDPRTLLLAGNKDLTETGPQYLLDWESGHLRELGDGTHRNCHDIQWSYDRDAYWMPGSAVDVEEVDAGDGSSRRAVSLVGEAVDINHVGLLEEDSMIVVSSRLNNAIIKARVATREIVWIAGGPEGTLPQRDMRGNTYSPGETVLFRGQHNAEYIGENEYAMFDNQYDGNRSSKLVVVSITNHSVEEVFAHTFAPYPYGYSPFFGDCDPLPSGHLIGCLWPSKLSGPAYFDVAYEVLIAQVDRDTKETLWSAKVYGEQICDSITCDRDDSRGWKLYSVERFFEAPLLGRVQCDDDRLSFIVFNNFKQNNRYPGTARLLRGNATVATTTFFFQPHWRPTTVHVRVDGLVVDDLDLLVTNQFGNTTRTTVICSGR